MRRSVAVAERRALRLLFFFFVYALVLADIDRDRALFRKRVVCGREALVALEQLAACATAVASAHGSMRAGSAADLKDGCPSAGTLPSLLQSGP
jgi:hypothetical protein